MIPQCQGQATWESSCKFHGLLAVLTLKTWEGFKSRHPFNPCYSTCGELPSLLGYHGSLLLIISGTILDHELKFVFM